MQGRVFADGIRMNLGCTKLKDEPGLYLRVWCAHVHPGIKDSNLGSRSYNLNHPQFPRVYQFFGPEEWADFLVLQFYILKNKELVITVIISVYYCILLLFMGMFEPHVC